MAVITPLFAAVFGLMYMALSFNVVRYRFASSISLGSAENKDLERAIRAHGNFMEYVPFTLLLMWFIETLTLSANLAFWLGAILLVARVFHALGMFYPRQLATLRRIGIVVTFGVIVKACFAILQYYMPITI